MDTRDESEIATALVLHVPHAATNVPQEIREDFLLDDTALADEVRRMTDWYTDELFARPSTPTVRFPVSRLVVDPERFLDDAQEAMAAIGMGVVYTATSSLEPLRISPTREEREQLIANYYAPHHGDLTSRVESALAAHGECVVIDCHSFPSVPLPYEADQSLDRPDLCIGTDRFHTPADLTERIKDEAEQLGLSVAVNAPFAGALVPSEFYRARKSVFGVMLEVNRKLYLDESTGAKHEGFSRTRQQVQQLLGEIDAWRHDEFIDRLLGEGRKLAEQFWDGGAPGMSGCVTAYDYYGSYLILHDAGFSIFSSRDEAIGEATREGPATKSTRIY